MRFVESDCLVVDGGGRVPTSEWQVLRDVQGIPWRSMGAVVALDVGASRGQWQGAYCLGKGVEVSEPSPYTRLVNADDVYADKDDGYVGHSATTWREIAKRKFPVRDEWGIGKP